MRKFLSVLLAVLILASVCVVSFSAADTGVAKVTIKGLKGETVTKTYAVGDTITAYTYLNASEINDGKIGSLHGSQFYTNAVLELDAECDSETGIHDLEAMFPVTKNSTMASGHWTTSEEYENMGAIYYNASIASYGGFKFNSDSAALLVANYKVKAAGNAEIVNSIETLAASDKNLTRIIDQGEVVNSSFTTPVALSEPVLPVPAGSTVSGSITSYLADDTVTLTLTGTDNNYTDTVNGETVSSTSTTFTGSYSFTDVPDGSYKLSVSKKDHVTRDEYEITVNSGDVTQDVVICPIGDTNMNGRVQSNDATKTYKHVQGGAADQLTGYAFKCADVNNNGRIQSNDATQIYRQAQGAHNLF